VPGAGGQESAHRFAQGEPGLIAMGLSNKDRRGIGGCGFERREGIGGDRIDHFARDRSIDCLPDPLRVAGYCALRGGEQVLPSGGIGERTLKGLVVAASMSLAFHALMFLMLVSCPKGLRDPSVPPVRQEPLSVFVITLVPQVRLSENPIVHPDSPAPSSAESHKPTPKKGISRVPNRPGKKFARISEETSDRIQSSFSSIQRTETTGPEDVTWAPEPPESPSARSTRGTGSPGPSGTDDISISSSPSKDAIPIYKRNPAPEYPAVARRRGYEGTVVLEVLVNSYGKVADLRLFRSSGHAVLDRTALSSVKAWVFDPARKGQEAVEMWVKIPVCFRLRDGETP
jgi:periplasmic protein TonB